MLAVVGTCSCVLGGSKTAPFILGPMSSRAARRASEREGEREREGEGEREREREGRKAERKEGRESERAQAKQRKETERVPHLSKMHQPTARQLVHRNA